MDQRRFLQVAKRLLGLTYPGLARELGVSARAVEKWAMDPGSPDHRPMPRMAQRFVLKLLDEKKRACLEAGDRACAEIIDALGAQVDDERLQRVLRTFDALQRTARRILPGAAPRGKPRHFRSLAEKNEWERREEIRHARRIASQTPGHR